MGYVKYTDEQLAEAVESSSSLAQVARALGMGRSGNNNTVLKRRIAACGIDTSHFTGQGWKTPGDVGLLKASSEILVYDPNRTTRTAVRLLRRALQDIGVPYECVECGNEGEWCGKPLTLHVDHIDGNPFNNLPSNLRFLCPNCHDQTPTNGVRNWKRV